ncbi:uncharacterized protein LOC126884954 [Diabrotica virgifera virgifera]|uniref:Uncharacterized protein n=1 Tax=Diabrotica virgifera virgifera TaxID=50390 RepID=A0ABM5KAR2_DIAVI|nr:uncharacterized protein LOC126884954 [Diabrotica virgifera virgifera]
MERYLETLDSDDTQSEGGSKRKDRYMDNEEDDIFRKSKKFSRTPTKNQEKRNEETKIDQLLIMMSHLTDDIKEIKRNQKESKEAIEKLIIENRALRKENAELKQENIEIKEELREITNHMEVMEKHRRINNVVMNGLRIDTYEQAGLKETTNNFIKQHLGVEVKIRNAHKLGENTCLIELENQEEKRKIMEKKYKLKEIRGLKVYINEDATIREREIQKTIRNIAQEERNKGNEVKIGVKKIWEDDQWEDQENDGITTYWSHIDKQTVLSTQKEEQEEESYYSQC